MGFVRTRVDQVKGLRGTILFAAVLVGLSGVGCASSDAKHWAQNSPVIAPEPSGATTVQLGARGG